MSIRAHAMRVSEHPFIIVFRDAIATFIYSVFLSFTHSMFWEIMVYNKMMNYQLLNWSVVSCITIMGIICDIYIPL